MASRASNQRPDPDASARKQAATIEEDLRMADVCDSKVGFRCEQQQLVHTPPTSLRYSQMTTKVATELFLSSRNANRAACTGPFHTLLHLSTFRDKVGRTNDIGSLDDAWITLVHVFQKMNSLQEVVQLKIDEI